jgi:hypothetical protein
MLVMSLGAVILVMRVLRQPDTVARVADVVAGDRAPPTNESPRPDSRPPKIGSDSFQSSLPENATPPINVDATNAAGTPNLANLLSLAGWTPERFAKFTDGEPLSDDERDELIQLLWRVRTIDLSTVSQVSDHNAGQRGELLQLKGKAKSVLRHELTAEDAARFEMPAYYTCELELAAGGGSAIVVTATVPRRWNQTSKLDEPASATGLYVKQLPTKVNELDAERPVQLVVADRIAWHPETAREPVVSLGMSILGSLGMDVGLLDQVRSHGPLHSSNASDTPRSNDEREAFYQMLAAAGKIGANQLIRFAKGNLQTIRGRWEREMAQTRDANRRALAHEVIHRAKAGLYSVAPLFNDAPRQQGQLIVVDGTARRVVRVEVGSRAGGVESDVARRFRIDHYYEMQVFTDDSQNYPLVFCVRELPATLPVGDNLHVPVRVAGFFFKDWQYTTRGTRDAETAELHPVGRQQHSPLLIGRAPILLQLDEKRGTAQLVGGGLFLLALGGIWAVAWWLSRGDRQFDERRRAAAVSLPPGQSLNDLNVPPSGEPISIEEVRIRDEG